jgi:hypothetical protein
MNQKIVPAPYEERVPALNLQSKLVQDKKEERVG